jgi:hypothetical protein
VILATLSLLPTVVTSQRLEIKSVRQVDRDLTGYYENEEPVFGDDEFTSFFEVEYETRYMGQRTTWRRQRMHWHLPAMI